jgi:Pyridoxamine 5'-phosphate oxidase
LTTPQRDLARIAQDAIDANSYLTPTTADRTGLPWPSPVWYADAGYRESFRVSAPGTRHSRNLAERPEAGIVIFDSHVPAGSVAWCRGRHADPGQACILARIRYRHRVRRG